MADQSLSRHVTRHLDIIQVAGLIVGADARGDFEFNINGSLGAMEAGYCKHVVSELGQFTYTLAANGARHCNKGAFGTEVIRPLEIALPIRRDIEPAMSGLISRNYLEDCIYL
eukprot:4294893-Pyramimonas_sp.AAC.1